MSALGLLAFATIGVSLLSLLPQLARVVRTRVTDGLSAGTIALTLVSYTLWGCYGLGISDGTQIVNNMFGLAVFLALAHLVARNAGVLRIWHAPVIVLGTAAIATTVSFVSSPLAAAAAGTVLGFFTKVPQVRVAVSGAPLWGLDPWATLLGMVSWLLWLSYGVLAGDPAVAVSSTVGVLLHAVITYHRLPPRRTLASLADGRLGPGVARIVAPVAQRFPHIGQDCAAAAV